MGTRGLFCIWFKRRCVMAQRIKGDAYPEFWGHCLVKDIKLARYRQEERARAQENLDLLERTNVGKDGADSEEETWCWEYEKELQSNLTIINDNWCYEWAYVLDLDDEVLEVYRGHVAGPKTEGHRFAEVGGDDDEVPKLVGSFTFKEVEGMTGRQFLDKIAERCEGYEMSLIASMNYD